MYLWELIAHRLRLEGWSVWHTTCRDASGLAHVVHVHRPGSEWQTTGPTLTEAFAAAARKARELAGGPQDRALRPAFGWPHAAMAG